MPQDPDAATMEQVRERFFEPGLPDKAVLAGTIGNEKSVEAMMELGENNCYPSIGGKFKDTL